MKINRYGKRAALSYHLLMLPGMAFLVIYAIAPMFGTIIAFQDFTPTKGIFKSLWVGLENFKFMFMLPDTWQILSNTITISVSKIVLTLVTAIFFALMLNEIRLKKYKRTVQTIVYLPHFLSWVILASVFRGLLDSTGIVNNMLMQLGLINEPILFLGDNHYFQSVIILSDVWKGYGYSAILFVAALTSVNPELYEAAALDGAGRWKQMLHVTLPGIRVTIVLVATLSLANIFNAGFDQIYNMYSPIVYRTGDVIDTYVYRVGFLDAQYSLATAVGTMKSVVSFLLIILAYKLAERFANYRIF